MSLSKYSVRGFTLTEILVVVSIIGIMAAAVVVSVNGSSAATRDAKRQGDLRNLQSAIETYRNENGRYPYQATSTGPGSNGWSGQIGTNFRPDNGSAEYIVGLAPEYISVLPTDPRLNGLDSGYVYRTNAAGTVYKLKAHRTVETESVTFEHEFKPCDIRVASDPVSGNLSNGSTDQEVVGWCARPQYAGSLPPTCRANQEAWRISYGLWGGYAPLFPPTRTSLVGLDDVQKRVAVRDTTTIICR